MLGMEFFNEEAEQMILSAILQKPTVLDEIGTKVSKSDFYIITHQNLYGLMTDLYASNRLDWRAVMELVRDSPEQFGESDYVVELRGALHTHYLIPHYCEKITTLATKRKIADIAMTLHRMVAEDSHESAESYIAAAHEQMTTLDVAQKSEAIYLHEELPKHIEDLFTADRKKSPLTGFGDIDTWMKGLGRDRLIVMAGRPGTGKTATSLRICREVAKQEFGPAIFFSLEMSKGELIDRMLSDAATVPFSNIQSRELDDKQKSNIRIAEERLKKFSFIIDDRSRMNINYIAAQLRRYKRKHGDLGLVIIDYLGLMDIQPRKGQNKTDAIGEVTRELKLMAKEIGCSILLLSQMSRDIEKRQNKRPVMSDLRDSGSIEQDADMVIFLYREDDEKQENPAIPVVDFIVAKGRQTGTKDFKLKFHGAIQRMESKFL